LATQLKQHRLADRRQLIIEAAIPIIGQRGYFGFSIKSLAEATGLTVPGVLHHFGSKEAILMAVLDFRERRDFEAVWDGLPFRDAEKLEAYSLAEFKRLMHETVVRNSQQPEILRLGSMLRIEALYPGHPAYTFFRDRNRRALRTFTHMLTGKVPEPAVAATLVISLMLGLEALWLGNPEMIDFIAQWDHGIEKILG
jgi:AcrR family transcriptional regulator